MTEESQFQENPSCGCWNSSQWPEPLLGKCTVFNAQHQPIRARCMFCNREFVFVDGEMLRESEK